MGIEQKSFSRSQEVSEIVAEIKAWELKECEARASIKTCKNDAEEENSLWEDSYLAYLKMVSLAKMLKPKEFNANSLDVVFDCGYEELEIPDFEMYLKQ